MRSSVKFTGEPTTTQRGSDFSSQTSPIRYADASVDPIARPEQGTQTIERSAGGGASFHHNLVINTKVIDLIIQQIEKCREESKYFGALEQMGKTESIRLVHQRTVSATDRLPIAGLCFGDGQNARTLAILFGSPTHDSWCTHSFGRLTLYSRTKQFQTSELPSCPTKVVFAQQSAHVLVGTALGEIFILLEGQTIWSSNQLHQQAVSSLMWLGGGGGRLMSAGLDGRVVMSALKGNSQLEVLQQRTLTITDLPRALRKANTSGSRCTGIVGVNGYSGNGEVWVAGETGALWQLDTSVANITSPTALQPLAYQEPESIDEVAFAKLSASLIVRTSEGRMKQLKQGSAQLKAVGNAGNMTTIKGGSSFCIYKGSLLLCISSPDGEIFGIDMEEGGDVVLREKMATGGGGGSGPAALAVSDREGELAIINNNCNISFYHFSNEI